MKDSVSWPFPASQGYLHSLAGSPFIYTAMTLTSDLGDGRGVGGRLGSISSGKWLV